MGNLLKIIVPRALGALASFIAGWIYVKSRGVVSVDPTLPVEVVGTRIVEVVGTMLGTYAGSHRILSSIMNPDDAASRRMVTAVKEAIESGTAVVPERKP